MRKSFLEIAAIFIALGGFSHAVDSLVRLVSVFCWARSVCLAGQAGLVELAGVSCLAHLLTCPSLAEGSSEIFVSAG